MTHSYIDKYVVAVKEKEQVNPAQSPKSRNDSSLENLIHLKGRIQKTKCEVFAFEIIQRLCLKGKVQRSVDEESERVLTMLQSLSSQANYHLRDHQEKRVLYEALFRLAEQRRSEEIECWKDVTMVMRDLLQVWELHESAKARSIFIENAGP